MINKKKYVHSTQWILDHSCGCRVADDNESLLNNNDYSTGRDTEPQVADVADDSGVADGNESLLNNNDYCTTGHGTEPQVADVADDSGVADDNESLLNNTNSEPLLRPVPPVPVLPFREAQHNSDCLFHSLNACLQRCVITAEYSQIFRGRDLPDTLDETLYTKGATCARKRR